MQDPPPQCPRPLDADGGKKPQYVGQRSAAMRETDDDVSSDRGAPLVAATFLLLAVLDANAPLDGSIGAPLVAATFTFSSRAMRGANAPLDGSVWAPLIAAM